MRLVIQEHTPPQLPGGSVEVIRHGGIVPTGLPLSYLELVEVAFATYFRRMGIPFDKIRNARQDMARHFGSSHPFAEIRFKTDGYHVLLDYPPRETEPYSIVKVVELSGMSARVFRAYDSETIVPDFDNSDPRCNGLGSVVRPN